MTDFEARLRAAFGDRLQSNVPLAPLTTFRVGGPAEWLIETRGRHELVTALRLAHDGGVNVTMLGGGSNVLVSDAGVRGLVIRPRGGDVQDLDEGHVVADAAVTINGLVRWTINHGRAGLEAWAGTPGTVGGAIFGNAHFGGRLIGDLVERVQLAGRDGIVKDVPVGEMAFGYDRSRLQTTGEILLSAVFRVTAGEPAALRAIARQTLA
jgi:UDP-N-acetylmuramate dehydrogenase